MTWCNMGSSHIATVSHPESGLFVMTVAARKTVGCSEDVAKDRDISNPSLNKLGIES